MGQLLYSGEISRFSYIRICCSNNHNYILRNRPLEAIVLLISYWWILPETCRIVGKKNLLLLFWKELERLLPFIVVACCKFFTKLRASAVVLALAFEIWAYCPGKPCHRFRSYLTARSSSGFRNLERLIHSSSKQSPADNQRLSS